MAEAKDTRVFYRTVADFASLKRELRQVRNELAKTKAAESAYNASSAKERSASTKASTTRAKALSSEAASLKATLVGLTKYRERQGSVTTAVIAANKAINAQNRALQSNALRLAAAAKSAQTYSAAQHSISKSTGISSEALRTQKEFAKAQNDSSVATEKSAQSLKKHAIESDNALKSNVKFVNGVGDVNHVTGEVIQSLKSGESAFGRWGRGLFHANKHVVRFREEGNKLSGVFARIQQGGERAFNSLEKFGNWRPRLVPPFVALIPIIGAVVAALNPLVSLLGALGGVAIGLAGQIGSLSGAFLALPGILSAVAAGIAGVIASMGGVGNVFKTYSAMQKAMGKGSGGGQSQAERAETLADAERGLAKAQRNVQKAQENLNKAREEALKDLIELRQEVSRAGMSEERAIADLRLAQEAYWNVMADPGSTMGDKLDAAAKVKEAEADLQDVRKKNIENQKALNEAEKKGIAQSDKVLDAQENLADAYDAQRKAQKALKAESAGGSSAAQAINDYNAALAELSPSAQKFVKAILAMQTQWKAFRKELQEEFFSRFVDDLDLLPQGVRNLTSFLKPAVKAMGELAGAFIRMFTSPEWTRDMVTLGKQNGSVLKNLGDAALSLATALKDIMIAAGPFTDWLTGSFATGADNFSKFIADARETGSLADWLDKVRVRLEKWWKIVKNIGKTIFNYSAAASSFGDWISDGLLTMTENWVKASEKAREPGSKFQKWLEDIKPVLSEVNRMLGAFFGWFAEESADPENLQSAVNLLKIITDKLGPALGRLLDTLAETDIDEKFLEALSSIIESIDTILENGGSAAFEAFFDIVEGFFTLVADVTSRIPKPILEGLLSLLGFLAGATFVGKFTGLTKLFGALLGLNGASGLFGKISAMVKNFGKLDKMKFKGVGGFLAGLGKFAGIVGLIATLGVSTWNSFAKGEEVRNLAIDDKNPFALTQDPEDAQKVLDIAKTDGSQITSNTIFGIINEVLYGLDDSLGTKMGEGFDSFLDDAVKNLANWVTVDLPNWWETVTTWWDTTVVGGWNSFWDDLSTGKLAETLGEEFGNFILDFQTNWDNFWGGIGRGFETASETLTTAWNNHWAGLGKLWDDFWTGFTTGEMWTKIGTELENFAADFGRNWDNFWGGIGSGFQTVVDNLGNIWAGIQNAFLAPVNWVITTVWNNGIVSFWNGLAGKLGLSKMPNASTISVPKASSKQSSGGSRKPQMYAEGGVLPGYTPGRDVHTFQSDTAGTLKLSGGEAIMRPEFTKLVGGAAGVEELNKKARRGESAFALGGVYSNSTVKPSSKKQKKADLGGDLLGKIFSDPIGLIGDGLKNLVRPLLAGMSDSGWSGTIKAIPPKLIDGLVGTVKSWFNSNPSGGGSGANPIGWQKQWAIVKNQFPSATLNSAFRSAGANAAAGGVKGSYHTQGRAIDTTPSMAIFNWLRQNFPNSRELIYSPAGSRQLQNGKNHLWGEPVRSQHFDHVHWAMKNGGVIPRLYDNGGWLPHGGAAINKSGKPEAVLTNDESRALKSLLGGSGLMGRNAIGSSAATAMSNATPVVHDYSVNVDSLVIQNPVPEKPSQSLPKAIRQIAYMNRARSGSDS